MRFSLKKALAKHGRRSHRAQKQDNRLRARVVIRRNNRSRFGLWFRAPNRYDIMGIDVKRRIIHRARRKLRRRISTPQQRHVFTRIAGNYLRRRRPGKVMNVGLQMHKLGRLIRGRGVAGDLMDTRSIIDRTLSYRENKRVINEHLNLFKPREYERAEVQNMVAKYNAAWRDYKQRG